MSQADVMKRPEGMGLTGMCQSTPRPQHGMKPMTVVSNQGGGKPPLGGGTTVAASAEPWPRRGFA